MRGLFHYNYKSEGVILDQQYNYQGNLLAVSNSNGDILFYSAEGDDSREHIFTCDKKKTSDRYAVIKIAWSLPIFGLFASASISREIDIYHCHKTSLSHYVCSRVDYIPLSLTFCPV